MLISVCGLGFAWRDKRNAIFAANLERTQRLGSVIPVKEE